MLLLFLVAVAVGIAPRPAAAQLRPLEPLDWDALSHDVTLSASAGGAVHFGQRSALAGARGRLLEAGIVNVGWRVGPVALEFASVVHRRFHVESRYATPVAGVAEYDGLLHDVGEVRVATVVPFPTTAFESALRFGTRLPVSDAKSGLDRDRTDFFATVAFRRRWGRAAVGGEAGVAINGTHSSSYYRQMDVLVYAARAEYRLGWLRPSLSVVGRTNGVEDPARGQEDLEELRVGLRAGDRYWIQAEGVRGVRRHSPESGVRVLVGARW